MASKSKKIRKRMKRKIKLNQKRKALRAKLREIRAEKGE